MFNSTVATYVELDKCDVGGLFQNYQSHKTVMIQRQTDGGCEKTTTKKQKQTNKTKEKTDTGFKKTECTGVLQEGVGTVSAWKLGATQNCVKPNQRHLHNHTPYRKS